MSEVGLHFSAVFFAIGCGVGFRVHRQLPSRVLGHRQLCQETGSRFEAPQACQAPKFGNLSRFINSTLASKDGTWNPSVSRTVVVRFGPPHIHSDESRPIPSTTPRRRPAGLDQTSIRVILSADRPKSISNQTWRE